MAGYVALMVLITSPWTKLKNVTIHHVPLGDGIVAQAAITTNYFLILQYPERNYASMGRI